MCRIAFTLLMVPFCASIAAALPGSGTQEDPWRIESLADFDEFASDANYWPSFTRLETDVNLAGRTYTTAVIAPDMDISAEYFQGTPFTGVFDGNDHKITNLTIDDGGAAGLWLGLFGYMEQADVRNLGLEGGSVTGEREVGGLVGENWEGSVLNCYSTGYVNGAQKVGGLVGFNYHGSVSNCHSTSYVSGNGDVGGLIGVNYRASVSNSYSNGDVIGRWNVGGLVGWIAFATVSNCHSSGSVRATMRPVGGLLGNSGYVDVSNCYSTGSVTGDDYVGGLVGWNAGDETVLNSYSTGDVTGEDYVAGLMGFNEGNVSNCYSAGDVNGHTHVGGLVGYHCVADLSNCFWDIDTQTHGVIESIGYNDWGTITNVAGLPTEEMQTKNTFAFAGWDLVGIWLINEGATYPVLRQEIRSDLNGDGGVDLLDFAIFAGHWLEGTGN